MSLWRTKFYESDLRSTDFSESNLVNGDLAFTNLRGASFTDSNLSWSSFFCSTANEVKFVNSNLRHANFEHASLVGADFTGADISLAYFNDSDISEAMLINVKPGCMTAGTIFNSKNIEKALYPDNFWKMQLRVFQDKVGISQLEGTLIDYFLLAELDVSIIKKLCTFSDEILARKPFDFLEDDIKFIREAHNYRLILETL